MSDGMTDVQRDEDINMAYADYIEALAAYLIDPSDLKLKKKVEDAAKESDDIKRGYFTGPTSLSNGLIRVLGDVANLHLALKNIGYKIVEEDL